MTDATTAVDQLFNGEYNNYKETVNDILMNKLKDRLDTERFNVGQAMFAADEQPEEEISDEEV